MRHRCEILNHGIHGYEVWLHQGRSGVKLITDSQFEKKSWENIFEGLNNTIQ